MAYRNNSSKFWTGFLAVLLVLVIAGTAALVGVLSDGFKNWDKFKPDEEQTEQQEETADNGGAIIGEGESNGIALMSAEIPVEEFAANDVSPMAESAYTLTATITPDDASDKTVDWSVAFVNASSEWATGKTVTDYVTVTPTNDGALTANVECLQAFGEQIKVVCSARDESGVSGTCTVDYAKRVVGATLDISYTSGKSTLSSDTDDFIVPAGTDFVTCSTSSSPAPYHLTYGVGTVDDSFTVSIYGQAPSGISMVGSVAGFSVKADARTSSIHYVGKTAFSEGGYYECSDLNFTMSKIREYFSKAEADAFPVLELVIEVSGDYSDYTFSWDIGSPLSDFTTVATGLDLDKDSVIF